MMTSSFRKGSISFDDIKLSQEDELAIGELLVERRDALDALEAHEEGEKKLSSRQRKHHQETVEIGNQAAGTLLLAYELWARKVASFWFGKVRGTRAAPLLEYDDFLSLAFQAMHECTRNYDPSKGRFFVKYCEKHVQKRLSDLYNRSLHPEVRLPMNKSVPAITALRDSGDDVLLPLNSESLEGLSDSAGDLPEFSHDDEGMSKAEDTPDTESLVTSIDYILDQLNNEHMAEIVSLALATRGGLPLPIGDIAAVLDISEMEVAKQLKLFSVHIHHPQFRGRVLTE